MRVIMSLINLMRRMSPLVVLGALMSSAHALPPQAVAPVKLPRGGHGVDGPFFPSTRVAPVLPSTGATLQQQAQKRVDARLGGNTVLSNGAAVTKAQAQSGGLGFVAKHFDEIDAKHTGRVTMSDVRQFIQQRQVQAQQEQQE
ncbi:MULTISPECIES: 2-oxoglutarate dehydrogenase [unclassified Burkholderia]|uniref:2-oxoglutarate dehydrogenase n=1 Tax=unclassified Burkholderia TaxID=2613784 RepID=UPI000F57027D|nr:MULTISPECIES: 2-oxoglutarate dehydrogenase [unclassified Burkholderia]RQR32528.1 2-oxoglutarate dehydrogenase [Burkholderia sp. Bp9131]RQR70506.1 2-oxoglutarate dehydrogenase [Burkholderia sp. Bp9015]RQR92616.1 2-oxoglutarate dehydrogenase [Burkholderia sp. Bp8994]RQS30426.1 2-oxoglutarate dehydrogenase [Burkholderia sp. Bp8995]RQS40037.1 2-oxoglutarate dehydrogenase [Burkholderia sp. Bp8990]